MRYYNIVVTSADGSVFRQWTSQVNGYNDRIAFQGTMQVLKARHVGHSRDPAGTNWTSIFQCALGA